MRRSYAGAAPVTQLAAGITAGSISFTVVSGGGNGYPDGSFGPFFVVLDENTADEEKILIATRVGDVFNVAGGGRGADDTTGAAHNPPCTVRHVYTATDADEANEHVNTDAGVHGVTGGLVGTSDAQVLTNKTIDGSLNTLQAVPQAAITGLAAAQAAQDAAIAAAVSDLDTEEATTLAHRNATNAHGATAAVVGTTKAQTLTNKTINPANNTVYGWQPISDGSANGVTGFTIGSIPAGFSLLRVHVRGDRVDSGATLIGMRINGLTTPDYDYGLFEVNANGGSIFTASGVGVTIPRVARWDASTANNFTVDIFDVSSGTTVSWNARHYRPDTQIGFSGGRRAGAVAITSLVFTHSESGDLGNISWFLEGYRET